MSLGGEDGTKLLRRLGLLEVAIDYATESAAFPQAFELAQTGAKQKLPEVSQALGHPFCNCWPS